MRTKKTIKYHNQLKKADQLELYRIIEPMIIYHRELGYKDLNKETARLPQFHPALAARQTLFMSFNGLITRIALNKGLKVDELDDVFSHCAFALDKALFRFNPDLGNAFSTFSYLYINYAVINFINQNSLIISKAKREEASPTVVLAGDIPLFSVKDKGTIDKILSGLSDEKARLITWYFGLNTNSLKKDTRYSLLADGIICTKYAVDLIISGIQEQLVG